MMKVEAGGTSVIASVNSFVLLAPVESVTLIVIGFVSSAIGVPDKTPAGFNVKPAGSGFDPAFRLTHSQVLHRMPPRSG